MTSEINAVIAASSEPVYFFKKMADAFDWSALFESECYLLAPGSPPGRAPHSGNASAISAMAQWGE
jgi:hypothetical protein